MRSYLDRQSELATDNAELGLTEVAWTTIA